MTEVRKESGSSEHIFDQKYANAVYVPFAYSRMKSGRSLGKPRMIGCAAPNIPLGAHIQVVRQCPARTQGFGRSEARLMAMLASAPKWE